MTGRKWLLSLTAVLLLCAVSASGCGTGRTVLVSERTPLRLGPDVEARVYVLIDGKWTLRDDRITLPEGWYLIPPSFVKPDDFRKDGGG